MSIKSPISWIGGKFLQRKAIVNSLPPHNAYVEIFGGGGHVLFHKLPSMSKVEVLNDLNSELVNFYLVVRDHADILIPRLDSLPYSRALYQQWKNEPLPDDNIERACRWFYILCSSFASKYGSGWAYSSVRSHAQEFRYSTSLIKPLQDRLKNVMIECLDFREIIKKYDTAQTVFFADPPYLGQSNKDYYYGRIHNKIPSFTERDHRDLAEMLNNIKGKALVCYYPVDLIKELYPKGKWEWNHYKKVLSSQKADCKEYRHEVILMNYPMLENLFGSNDSLVSLD